MSLENKISGIINKTKKSLKSLAYAGIIGLALAGGGREAKATLNSNSIIKDNIEYYMQTDKAVYDLGENVEMLYRVTNLGSENITFNFDDQVQYCFLVKDNGNTIWDTPKAGFPGGSIFVLQPNNFKEYSKDWNMLNNQGSSIRPGTYYVTGSLHPVFLIQEDKYAPVSVQVEIIPEPATLGLVGLGLAGLYLNRKKT